MTSCSEDFIQVANILLNPNDNRFGGALFLLPKQLTTAR